MIPAISGARQICILRRNSPAKSAAFTKSRWAKSGRRGRRTGTSLTELVVASSLLVTAAGLVATSAVGTHRLLRLEQQNRVAVDELSNQLERLTLMQDDELETALLELEVSDWAARSLRDAVLSGTSIDDASGRRIKLTIRWDRVGTSAPLTAVRWIDDRDALAEGEGA